MNKILRYLFFICLLLLASATTFAQIENYGLIFNVADGRFYIDEDGSGSPVANPVYTMQQDAWNWNDPTTTLSLNDFVWETSAACALIIVNGNVNIELRETNTIATLYSGAGSAYGILTSGVLAISGNGLLIVSADNTADNTYAIYSRSLTINGGRIEAIAGATTGGTGISQTISTIEGLTINGGTIIAVSGTGSRSCAISVASVGLTMTGGNINLYAESETQGIGISSLGGLNLISGTITSRGDLYAIEPVSLSMPAAYQWTKSVNYDSSSSTSGTFPSTSFSNTDNPKYVKIESHSFCGGSGTTSDPYQICTAEQLNQIHNYLDKSFILMNDIDLEQFIEDNDPVNGWLPIGGFGSGIMFKGAINGAGYKITGLWIDRPDSYFVGLFGYTMSARFENLGIEIAEKGVTGDRSVGGLVGINVLSPISNCYVTGNVYGTVYVGGLAGVIQNTDMNNCFATANVTGISVIGGLVGNNNCFSTITNCYATGNVTGVSHLGGLVGVNDLSPDIINCYAVGKVTGNDIVGGFLGKNEDDSIITDCFFDRQTAGQIYAIGVDNNIGGTAGVNGRSTAALQMRATFTNVNWDFSATPVWDIWENRSYPFFVWQSAPVYNPISNGTIVTFELRRDAELVKITVIRDGNILETLHVTFREAGKNTVNLNTLHGDTLIFTVYEYNKAVSCPVEIKTITPLQGTVAITGSAVYGETLTADLSGMTTLSAEPLGTLTYKWKIGTTVIGTTTQYNIIAADIGNMITLTVFAENYADSLVSFPTASVLRKTITLTGTITASKVYDGTNSFDEASINITNAGNFSGIVGTDVVALDKTGVTGTFGPDAGSGTLTLTNDFRLSGADADNYILTQPTVPATISQRPITVTAKNETINYGTNPVLEFEVTSGNFVNNDNLTGALEVDNLNIGTHAIRQGQLTAGDNYIITFVEGTLTVLSVNTSIGEIIVGGENVDISGDNFFIVSKCGDNNVEVRVITDQFATVEINGVAQNPRTVNLPKYGDNLIAIKVTAQNGNLQNYSLTIYKSVPPEIAYYDRFENVLTVPVQIEGIGTVNSVEWYRNGVRLDRDPTKGYIETKEAGTYYALINGSIRTCEITKTGTKSLIITAYPNPTDGELKINSEGVEIGMIQVFDNFGKLVLETRENPFNISVLPSGIYLIKVNEQTTKVIKN